MEKNTITHVILTGGVGSRLWPLSRKSQPKQYLEIFDQKSLFEMTVERNGLAADKVIVVGNADNYQLSNNVMNKTQTSYINIVEASPRNTAAAIAFAAFAADPDDILLVTPSDHIIDKMEDYNNAVQKAAQIAREGYIATFGIIPSKPETGYGYIEYDGDSVISFREKPNETTAKDFIAKGNFLWNSGMFCFKAQVLLDELKQFQPDVYEAAKAAWQQNKEGFLDLEKSLEIPSISIDYAVMERSRKIKVVPASFDWSDLGSFESVYDYLATRNHPVDKDGNMVIGCDKHTTFLGLKNTIFVYTGTANLILQKENSQEVKDIYSALEKENSVLLN